MGGIAITQGAANARDHVDRLIYLTAFLPGDGDSLGSLASTPEGQGDLVQANLIVEPPVGRLSDEALADVLYSSCSAEQTAWAVPQNQPQPLAPLGTPVALDGGIEEIDRYYISCTQDRAIPPALQRRMSTDRPCKAFAEIDTDHSPFLSATTETADLLDRFARA